jgi:hypothetical protein
VAALQCEECGFDSDVLEPADLIAAVRTFGKRYRAPVTRFLPNEDGPAVVRERPAPDVWSALEYVVHVRDALGFYDDRIRRVVEEDRPQLERFDFGPAAGKKNEEDPSEAAQAVAAISEQLASRLESLSSEQWDRVGLSSDGDGGERTVRILAARAVHEGQHHLLDVGRSLRHARGR